MKSAYPNQRAGLPYSRLLPDVIVATVCLLLGCFAPVGSASAQRQPPVQQGSASTEQPTFRQSGLATWYGGRHVGRKTASGELFDGWALTAAHRTLPFGTIVRVTDIENGRSIKVRINDRGPYTHPRHRAIIDLSKGAAMALGVRR